MRYEHDHTHDIARIERNLSVLLPPSYKQILLQYPFPPDSPPDQYELFGDPSSIIAINQEHRTDGFFGQDWPSHYLIIGADGCGNIYCLDVTHDPSPVFLADHENTARSKRLVLIEEAPSMMEWVAHLKQEQAAFEAEEQAKRERKQRKRWWEFWI